MQSSGGPQSGGGGKYEAGLRHSVPRRDPLPGPCFIWSKVGTLDLSPDSAPLSLKDLKQITPKPQFSLPEHFGVLRV